MTGEDNERIFLSMLFIKPSIFIETIVTEEMFTSAKRSKLFQVMKGLYDQGIGLDEKIITSKDPELDSGFLFDIINAVPTTVNWDTYYQPEIVEAWKRNRLRIMGLRLSNTAFTTTTEEVLSYVDDEIEKIAVLAGKRSVVKVGDALMNYIAGLEERYNKRGILPGLSTGIPALDEMIQGLQNGLLYVIGARPSQGKSALALNIARFISVVLKEPSGLILAESSIRSAINRLLSDMGNVNGTKITSGFMGHSDFSRIMGAAGQLYEAPIYIWDESNPTLADCRSTAKFMVRRKKIKVLFVDYAQIIQVPEAENRNDSVTKVCMGMKKLARDLDIPVVLLAQLGRDADDRRPGLGDFQWSSQFEQDGDVCALLWHVYNKTYRTVIDESWLLVEKTKDGPTGAIKLKFEKDYVRFVEAAQREREKEEAKAEKANPPKQPALGSPPVEDQHLPYRDD